MKLMTMTMAGVLAAMTVVACTAESADIDAPQVDDDTVEAARQNNGTNGVKTIGDLEGDGYTCQAQAGTTLTLCWKGKSTWSCDPSGKCIEMARTAPRFPPVIVAPPVATFTAAP